jgi:hypothetical protein
MALRLEATLRTFLDRKAVIDAVDRAELRVMKKVGSFTMRSDRNSIKERPGISAPGKPPHGHTTYFRPAKPPKSGATPRKRPQKPQKRLRFRDSILFSYDPVRKSVVIGPVLYDRPQTPTVPQLLEQGGRMPGNGGSFWATNAPGRNAKGQFVTGGKTLVTFEGAQTYRPRPHTGPAFQKVLRQELPRVLKDCVTK